MSSILTQIGLAFDIVGVILVYLFALSKDDFMGVEQWRAKLADGTVLESPERRFSPDTRIRISTFGILMIVGGFFLQLIAQWI